VVAQLTPADDAGYVVLFTPARGFESFSSLAEMNRRLRETMAVGSWRKEFMSLLPRRYWGLSVMGVWPLQLVPINSEPLCEHTYDARLAKRALDIDWALSLDANPDHSARQLLAELDDAIRAPCPTSARAWNCAPSACSTVAWSTAPRPGIATRRATSARPWRGS